MSSRFCASIRIGGPIEGSKIEPLVLAIRAAGVSCDWGDAPFEPEARQELLDALKDGHLWLCDEQANYGEFPALEAVCRKLGLGYTRHSEASFDSDAELMIWRPGMKKPIFRVGSNINGKDTYVPTEVVRRELSTLDLNPPDPNIPAGGKGQRPLTSGGG